jgi:hypothetical protein
MDFRAKLLSTLRAIEPILLQPGVLVGGSEVPNLLEPGARSSLVVSQDVDIVVSVPQHANVKRRLRDIHELEPSQDEASVWLPKHPGLIEVNFIGMDPSISRAGETYVLEDSELPLLVFGQLSFLRPAEPLVIEGLAIPVPRPAGLLLEKMITDRTGEKGDRDLLVVLGLLLVAAPADLEELETIYTGLPPDLQYAVLSNLTVLSLLEPRAYMPDPRHHRHLVGDLLRRLEDLRGVP